MNVNLSPTWGQRTQYCLTIPRRQRTNTGGLTSPIHQTFPALEPPKASPVSIEPPTPETGFPGQWPRSPEQETRWHQKSKGHRCSPNPRTRDAKLHYPEFLGLAKKEMSFMQEEAQLPQQLQRGGKEG